mgnify:CR=1 FL=1
MDDLARIEVDSAAALWAWLAAHHGQAEGVWLVTWKKADPGRYVSREAVLDALIAYGWTDGRRKVLDDLRTMQLISPRRQQVWAESYRTRAARLIDEGRIQPPGLAAIEAAQAAGTWDGRPEVEALQVPDDLAVQLAAAPGAGAWFAQAAPSYRRNVLRWLAGAKRAETRARRLAEIAGRAARGEKVPQF